MNVIVTDAGFGTDDWTDGFTDAELDIANVNGVDVGSDGDPDRLKDRLVSLRMIRVDFPSSADGRGFTIARRLRLMGFKGRLRARGHVLADQYAMARRSGFDEVEISADLAKRQPEPQWIARANWQKHDYQSRLRARA